MGRGRGTIKSDLFKSVEPDLNREKKRGLDEGTIYKGDEGTEVLKINSTKLESALEKLAAISHTKRDSIDESNSELYKIVTKLLIENSNTPQNTEIVEMIRKVFEPYKPFKPGTVGAELAGCVHNDSFFEPSCSAVCGGSIHQPNVPGWNICSYNVIHWNNGLMTLEHKNAKSSSAIVHIISGTFKGFTEDQIDSLKHEGIESAIIKAVGSSDYSVTSAEVPIGNLPKVNNEDKTRGARKNEGGSKNRSCGGYSNDFFNGDWSWGAIIFFIILIFIIILIIFYAFRNSSYYKNEKKMNGYWEEKNMGNYNPAGKQNMQGY